MAELQELLQQSRQIRERIRVLADEYETLRIRYHLLQERHKPISSSNDRRSEGLSIRGDASLMVWGALLLQHVVFWKAEGQV